MSKPYRTSDFLARRADAAAKAAKDVGPSGAPGPSPSRHRADPGSRESQCCLTIETSGQASYGPSHPTAAHLRGSLFCGLKQTAAARRAGYSNRGHAANRSA